MIGSQTVSLMRLVAIAVLTATLGACASVPLLTMWKLSSFKGSDLKSLDPDDIRVVVKLPDNVKPDPDKTTLKVTLTPKDSQQPVVNEQASLVLLNQGRYVPADVPVAEVGETWYLMKLSPDGVKSFRQFQRQLDPDMKQHYKSFSINAEMKFADSAVTANEKFRMTVWLQMIKQQGYFELFDDVLLAFKPDKQPDAPQSTSH